MSKTSVIVAFAVGASAGAVTSWLLLKRYYDNLVKEEIQSVKDTYKKKYDAIDDEQDESKDSEEEDAPESERAAKLREYKERVAEFGYSDDSDEEKKEAEPVDAPYVIAPEDFGEDDTYDTETLTYYADGVLTDDFDNQIDDIEGMVGEASLNTFGQYEDDAVHVKNDKFKTYYEILKDDRTFVEAMRTRRGR